VLIKEKDLKIECDGNYYTLYFLKSKKELTEEAKQAKEAEKIVVTEEDAETVEDLKNPYKVRGYYKSIKYAFLAAYKWRKDKKYPFKEGVEEFTKAYIKYKKAMDKLDYLSYYLYSPINILKNKVFEKYRKPRV
jgi:hypothetical protein